jgi:hypothetical protein
VTDGEPQVGDGGVGNVTDISSGMPTSPASEPTQMRLVATL